MKTFDRQNPFVWSHRVFTVAVCLIALSMAGCGNRSEAQPPSSAKEVQPLSNPGAQGKATSSSDNRTSLVASGIPGDEKPRPDASPSQTSGTTPPDTGSRASAGLPPVPLAVLSGPARRVAQLVDEGKLTAAQTALRAYLAQDPTDGGLYAQQTRVLIATEEVVFDFEESPWEQIETAARNAVEFNPALRPYMADALLRGAHRVLKSKIDEEMPVVVADLAYIQWEIMQSMSERSDDTRALVQMWEGFGIAGVRMMCNLQFGHEFLTGCWSNAVELAVEFDESVAARWSPRFADLSPSFVQNGWYASSLYMITTSTFMESREGMETRKVDRGLRAFDAILAHCRNDKIRGALAVIAFNNFFLANEDRLVLARKLADEKDPRLIRVVTSLAEILVAEEWLGGQPNLARRIAGEDD